MADTLALTQELMRRASISPEDGGCQDLMIERLEAIENGRMSASGGESPPLPTRHYQLLTMDTVGGFGDTATAGDLVHFGEAMVSKASRTTRLKKSSSVEVRNETRIVNEAFQVREKVA